MSEEIYVTYGRCKIIFRTNDRCYPSLEPPLLKRAEHCLNLLPQVQRQRERERCRLCFPFLKLTL